MHPPTKCLKRFFLAKLSRKRKYLIASDDIDLFTDTAAIILNATVSNSYCGIVMGQIHTYLSARPKISLKSM